MTVTCMLHSFFSSLARSRYLSFFSDSFSFFLWSLLSILADLNSVAVWMVSTRPLISKSSGPFINTLVTVPIAPITTDIIVTFLFHSFSNSHARSKYLFFFPLFSILLRGQPGQQSPQFCKFSYFFFIIIKSGRLAEIRWSVCNS